MTRQYLTPLPRMLARALTLVLNKALAYDRNSAKSLAILSDRVLAIGLEGLSINLYFQVRQEQFEVSITEPETVHTWIKGTPPALIGMSTQKQYGQRPGAVQIQGDAELAKAYQDFFRDLQPDWEEALAQRFGDVIGFRLAKTITAIRQWLLQAQSDLASMTGDYLKEESRLLITQYELDDFMEAVDDMRDDVDRLAARIQQLTARESTT